jgi:hypothetical protein
MILFVSLQIYFKSQDVKACIVTCGGLCPGINTVIREIVCGLWTQYGVRDIYGIDVSMRYQSMSIPVQLVSSREYAHTI